MGNKGNGFDNRVKRKIRFKYRNKDRRRLKFGKIGAVFGVFAKHKIKNEIDKIIEQFDKS